MARPAAMTTRDLAQRIEGAEVHQDDVHDVAAMRDLVGIGEVEFGQATSNGLRDDTVEKNREAQRRRRARCRRP